MTIEIFDDIMRVIRGTARLSTLPYFRNPLFDMRNVIATPRFTGTLHAGWRYGVDEQIASGWARNIENVTRYARYQESGTRPHFVPARYIRPWAMAHGIRGAESPGWRGMTVTGRAQYYARDSAPSVGRAMLTNVLEWFGHFWRNHVTPKYR